MSFDLGILSSQSARVVFGPAEEGRTKICRVLSIYSGVFALEVLVRPRLESSDEAEVERICS
jgi:hypothetical protein